jgi:hypothetical protein
VQTLKGYISERFVNAVGDKDIAIKNKYKKQVWDVLQKSYAGIGGIKGNGFQNMETMVKKIPMWKIVVNNGTVEAVVLYKDKGGRKSVAMGSTGSAYARKALSNILQAEFSRSYGEKSKAALGKVMKDTPWEVLEPFIQNPVGLKDVVTLKDYKGAIPDDAVMTLKKYPQLKPYGYFRDIGGNLVFKVMIGTPGKSIR